MELFPAHWPWWMCASVVALPVGVLVAVFAPKVADAWDAWRER